MSAAAVARAAPSAWRTAPFRTMVPILSALGLAARRVPAFIVTEPVMLLLPERRRIPGPSLLKLPVMSAEMSRSTGAVPRASVIVYELVASTCPLIVAVVAEARGGSVSAGAREPAPGGIEPPPRG